MKKILMTLTAVLCCAMFPVKAGAQNIDPSQFFSVDTLKVMTRLKFEHDFNGPEYQGDQLWAGLQSIVYVVKVTNYDEVEFKVDSYDAYIKFADIYGLYQRSIYDDDPGLKEDWEDFVDGCGYVGTSNADYSPPCSFDLARGGQYVLSAFVDFMHFERKDTMTIYDNPSIRIGATPEHKVGEDVEVTAYFNTGYPYDINSLTGEEYADVTLFKLETDSTAITLDKQRFSLSKMKDEAHPLLAGIDTVTTTMLKPEPGMYVLRYETNWQAVQTRDYIFDVEDTLRANVTLDKQTYDLTTDKQAHLTLKMDYRYPHVQAVEPDSVPTIRVTATLLKDKAATDSLMTDTLYIVSDTLATKDLNYAGQWDLDLTKIDASQLTDGESTYQLKINITFNNEQQYETFIPVELRTATGISILPATRTDDEATYTLSGIRMNPRKPLSSGIYIRKGKKIISK